MVRKSDQKLLTWLRLPEDSPLHIPAGVYLVPNLLESQEAVFGRRLEVKSDSVKREYARVDGRALVSVLQSAELSESDLSRLRHATAKKAGGKLILLGKAALKALRKRDLHPPVQWREAGEWDEGVALPGLPTAAPVIQVSPTVTQAGLLYVSCVRVWGAGCGCDRGTGV